MPTEIPSTQKKPGSEFIQVVRPFAWFFAALLGLVSLALRFAPLPENFATFGALALFCGLFLTGPARWFAPALILFAADCLGHFLNVPGMGFYHPTSMLLNYIAFAAVASIGAGCGTWWNRTSTPVVRSIAWLPFGVIAGSFVFFLISNFGAWLDPQMGYESSLAGLGRCYWMGLPFWRATLASDLFFGLGFPLAAWGISSILSSRLRQASV